MTSFVAGVTQILSLFTIGFQVLIVFCFTALIVSKNKQNAFLDFLGNKAIELAFCVALAATAASLFLSEFAGFAPCNLCWYQRAFMFPQVVLFGIALLKKDKNIFEYALWLSAIGFLIGAYQYLLQFGVAPNLPCSASGASISCSQRYFVDFGYITIPLMSATSFAFLFLLGVIKKLRGSN